MAFVIEFRGCVTLKSPIVYQLLEKSECMVRKTTLPMDLCRVALSLLLVLMNTID